MLLRCKSVSMDSFIILSCCHWLPLWYMSVLANSSEFYRFPQRVYLIKLVNLKSSDIGTNGLVTNLSFLRFMPNLKCLVLDYCIEIDCNIIVDCMKYCPLLEELSVNRCTQLTLDAIKCILSDRSYLKKIYIEKTMILSTEEVQDVLERSNSTYFSSWPDFSVWPVEENT